MTFPERICNTAWRAAHRTRRLIWRIVQPTTMGVKVIARDPQGRVLLVKARYLEQWTLPGGGVHKREMPEDAAAREPREETGFIAEVDELLLLGVLSSFKEGKSDYVAVFACEINRMLEPTPGAEIAEAAWFPADDVPTNTSERTRRRINEFLRGESMRGLW